jgi:UDP-3-O-[3-hydroxymyristoyl] N-acetylglucosamine deacetylase
VIAGRGLHRGEEATLRLRPAEGPVTLNGVAIRDLVLTSTARSTSVNGIGTVEHLFAALEAKSIREGLAISLEGPEMPLADGGALAFFDAIPEVAAGARPIIVQDAIIDGYTFRRAPTVTIEVAVDFADERIAPRASWHGDPADFRARIAPARTFGFEHELGALLERGLASHVRPETVLVFTSGEVLCAGRPYAADEPARHKLLDLLGDLYLHGGAPIGFLRAERPGHERTHRIMRRALDAGVVRAMIAP